MTVCSYCAGTQLLLTYRAPLPLLLPESDVLSWRFAVYSLSLIADSGMDEWNQVASVSLTVSPLPPFCGHDNPWRAGSPCYVHWNVVWVEKLDCSTSLITNSYLKEIVLAVGLVCPTRYTVHKMRNKKYTKQQTKHRPGNLLQQMLCHLAVV